MQARVINLLATPRRVSDRVMVMYPGKIIESGLTQYDLQRSSTSLCAGFAVSGANA